LALELIGEEVGRDEVAEQPDLHEVTVMVLVVSDTTVVAPCVDVTIRA